MDQPPRAAARPGSGRYKIGPRMPFTFSPLAIPGVVLVEPRVFGDARGFVLETFRHSDFVRAGIPVPFVQENHSHSARGTLRGLHYQREPYAQGKFVRVVHGHIFDVAVDMRPESSTYKHWVGVDLTADNRHGLYIPAGCAHGFCVLSESADVTYLLTGEYAPEHETGIAWNDPTLGIAWPLGDPRLSPRDQAWPSLT
jgi:dTDP-4-dehydrorhamnose 3,5-epimerase